MPTTEEILAVFGNSTEVVDELPDIGGEFRVFGPPGTGKTTYLQRAIIEAANKHGSNSIIVASFTRAAAAELVGRDLPLRDEQIGTLHAHCYRAIGRQTIAETKINEWNVEQQSYAMTGEGVDKEEKQESEHRRGQSRGDELFAQYNYLRAVMRPRNAWPLSVVAFATKWEAWKHSSGYIDFRDMIDIALRDIEYAPGRPEIGFFDECVPPWTPVQLFDGTSMPISEIVDNKISVDVLTYNSETGDQEPGRVIAWHKILNQKPLVKITVRPRNLARKTAFVVCTEDHKIWCDEMWVPASEVKVGMIAQTESSAITTQKGKISARGKESIAKSMIGNDRHEYVTHWNKTIDNRGGNGREMPLAQRVLLEALGEEWIPEYVVGTGNGNSQRGLPKNYKIDIANRSMRIAIEVDGDSHGSRKDEDDRKTAWLSDHGWKVYRFTNREAIQRTNYCVSLVLSNDCPEWATVISVEKTSIRESYVYDISVDVNHNFYANSILVHNCQDFDAMELQLVRKWGKKMNFIIMAADDDQTLYSWIGATPDAFLNPPVDEAHKRILRQSYRVPRGIAEFALSWVSHVQKREPKEYRPRDYDGELRREPGIKFKEPDSVIDDMQHYLNAGKSVMVLASASYMIDPLKMKLREEGIPFQNQYRRSRGDWNPLTPAKGVSTSDRILAYLRPMPDVWGEDARIWNGADMKMWQSMVLNDKIFVRGSREKISQLADNAEISFTDLQGWLHPGLFMDLMDCNLDWLNDRINALYKTRVEFPLSVARRYGGKKLLQSPQVTIGTIHSVKGGEADVVYVFPDISLAAGRDQAMRPVAASDEFRRLFYVAMTRARESLIICGQCSPYQVTIM